MVIQAVIDKGLCKIEMWHGREDDFEETGYLFVCYVCILVIRQGTDNECRGGLCPIPLPSFGLRGRLAVAEGKGLRHGMAAAVLHDAFLESRQVCKGRRLPDCVCGERREQEGCQLEGRGGGAKVACGFRFAVHGRVLPDGVGDRPARAVGLPVPVTAASAIDDDRICRTGGGF